MCLHKFVKLAGANFHFRGPRLF